MADRMIPGKATLFFRECNGTPLKEGDCIKEFDGSLGYVQYVNTSGAYVVPLAGINREIKGTVVVFNAGGRTISVNAIVEKINPITLGGNSHEYRRYAKMVEASKGRVQLVKEGKGVPLGDFDTADIEPIPGSEYDADSGTVSVASLTLPNNGRDAMAKKKAAKKTNGAAKRDRAPKTVRKCVCGCGTDTTGHFAPGHDARYHGWIKKLAAGKMKPSEIPGSLRNHMGLKETKDGYRATTPEFYKHEG